MLPATRVSSVTERQRLVGRHAQQPLELYEGRVGTANGQQLGRLEAAQLHVQQIAFERRGSTYIDASAHEVQLALGSDHHLVGDGNIPHGSGGGAVLQPDVGDEQPFAIRNGELRRLQLALGRLHASLMTEQLQGPFNPNAGLVVRPRGLVSALEGDRRIRAQACLLPQSPCHVDVGPRSAE